MFSLATLKHPAVRDLAFSCFGPDLVKPRTAAWPANCGLSLTPARQQWLQQLDQAPAALENYLSDRHSTRLGIYFEYLWRFFIEQDPALTLVCHNLPVYQQKRTLGEFDVIYFCQQRQQHFHLEMAIKFYMGWQPSQPTGQDASYPKQPLWIGPNSRDRLDIKLARLLNHQSQLSQTEAGKQALAALGVDRVSPELAVKGWLFYPADNQTVSAPAYAHSAHQRGHWLRLSTFANTATLKDKNWAIIERAQWLSPARAKQPSQHGEVLSALETHFEHYTQSVMVAELDHQGHEQARWFICNDQWPSGDVTDLSPHLT